MSYWISLSGITAHSCSPSAGDTLRLWDYYGGKQLVEGVVQTSGALQACKQLPPDPLHLALPHGM